MNPVSAIAPFVTRFSRARALIGKEEGVVGVAGDEMLGPLSTDENARDVENGGEFGMKPTEPRERVAWSGETDRNSRGFGFTIEHILPRSKGLGSDRRRQRIGDAVG